MSTSSFALYANPTGSGASADAERSFNNSLAIGQTLSFQWGINYDSGSSGNKGFSLYAGGVEIFNVNNGGSQDITCNGVNVGFEYGTAVMTWSFTRVDANTVTVSANDRDGSGTFLTSVVVSNASVDKLKFYAFSMQAGDAAQPYFNNLLVTEPVANSMAVPGDHAFLGAWQPDGSNGTGMARSSNPATPNLWTSYFKSSDARLISFKFVADGSFDYSWGADPSRAGYAKRGGDSITLNIPATGLYKFSFDQLTLQYSLIRAGSADFGSYQRFYDTYNLTGGESEDDDRDGLTNGQEYLLGTDPSNSDSDADSLLDGYEVNTSQTSPLVSDSDNDGLPDGWEVARGLNPNSSTGNEGASGDPDNDTFTNKQEFEGQSNPLSAASVPANRAVTFSIDLRRQIAAGSFSASSSAVEVWGTFNDWGNFTTKYSLTNNGSGTYSGTFVVPGANEATSRYKFVTFDGNNTLSWEQGSDRVLVMGANGQAINLSVAYLGEVRAVTFSVNMGIQRTLGRFTHGTDKVFVAGTDVAGGWDPGTELIRVGTSDVYSGTIWIAGNEGGTSNFKFKVVNALNYEDSTKLGTATRVLTLGARDLAQVNPEVYFNNLNELPPTRTVTFAVDMRVQSFRGAFTPGTDSVYLVGDASDWTTGTLMTREGATTVYKATVAVEGAENSTKNYKFRSGNTAVGNGGFEGDLDAGVPGDTPRVLTLGAPAVAQNLITANFNNQTEARKVTFRVDMSVQAQLGNFNPSTGTVKVAGTFNGWTAADLTAQGSGIYAGEFVVNGPLSAVEYKFVNGNTYEPNVANRTIGSALTNLSASILDPVYFNNVSQAGSTFSSWSGGAALNAGNLAKYAIGGASGLTAQGEAPKVGTGFIVPNHYSYIEAIVRTDDSKLTIVGEASTDLDAGFASTGTWTTRGKADGVSQLDVPNGCERKRFIYWHGMVQERMFLRLRAILNP